MVYLHAFQCICLYITNISMFLNDGLSFHFPGLVTLSLAGVLGERRCLLDFEQLSSVGMSIRPLLDHGSRLLESRADSGSFLVFSNIVFFPCLDL